MNNKIKFFCKKMSNYYLGYIINIYLFRLVHI